MQWSPVYGSACVFGVLTSDARECRPSRADWAVALPALLAGASIDAARAWLGYVPSALQEDADALFRELQAGALVAQVVLLAGLLHQALNFSLLPVQTQQVSCTSSELVF